jgi:hypothetical protein
MMADRSRFITIEKKEGDVIAQSGHDFAARHSQ